MALPNGIATFQLTFGAAAVLGADEALGMRITVTAATSAIWGATGQPFLMKKQTATAAVGQSGSITLISPDQTGFRNANGDPIRGWTYGVGIEYLDAGGNTVGTASKSLAYTAGMGSVVDLDLTIPVTTSAGVVVNVPGGSGFVLPPGGLNGQVLGLVNGSLGWLTVNAGTTTPPTGGGTPSGDLTLTIPGDGTATVAGTGVTDNADGTVTINSTATTDNGDGTYTLVA